MKRTIKFSLIALFFFTISTACKKIATPNDESKLLFGSWNYRGNTGGISGTGGSTRFNVDAWLDFSDKGRLTEYIKSKKESKKRYTIELKESIYSSEKRNALVYEDGSFETFTINADTLWISDENYDGYTYKFVKI